jgi:hypothetical protein
MAARCRSNCGMVMAASSSAACNASVAAAGALRAALACKGG